MSDGTNGGKTEQSRSEFITQTQQERNAGVLQAWFPRWVWNTASNFKLIYREFIEQKHEEYALRTQRNTRKGPALIVGAGPSFNDAAPLLKKWRGPLFVPESMAHTCAYWGRSPEYIGLYDAHPNSWNQFFEGLDFPDSTLVTHPAVAERSLEMWKGKKLYYTMMHKPQPDYTRIVPNMTLEAVFAEVSRQMFGDDFFSAINPILFPYIGTSILNAGCVVNNMIQIAKFMGYGPLVLVGVDFGYPNNDDRCTGYHMVEGEWKERETMKIGKMGRPMHIADNGVVTTEEQIEYKIALMAVMAVDKPDLIDCSAGIITEFPKADFAEVVKKRARGFPKLSYETKERIATEFLERQDKLSAEAQKEAQEKKEREAVAVDG